MTALTNRQRAIIRILSLGLTSANSLDTIFFRRPTSPTFNQRKSKFDIVDNDHQLFRSALLDLASSYPHVSIDQIQARAMVIAGELNNRSYRRGAKKICKHINHSLLANAKPNKSGILAYKLDLMTGRLLERVRSDIAEQMVRDRRRKVLRPLLDKGLIRSIALTAEDQARFGDKAYHLTAKGADYLCTQIAPGQFDRHSVRAYNFQPHTAAHDIVITDIYRSLIDKQKKCGYKLQIVLDEPSLRRHFRSAKQKAPHLVDLYLELTFCSKRMHFYLEIDNGSQPASLFITRAKLYQPLIYVCTHDTIARRLHLALQKQRLHMSNVYITTVDRLLARGIWNAGYLTRARCEYCQCSKLVRRESSGGVEWLEDEHGCPCILRYFAKPEDCKPHSAPQSSPQATSTRQISPNSRHKAKPTSAQAPVRQRPSPSQSRPKPMQSSGKDISWSEALLRTIIYITTISLVTRFFLRLF